jgi:hypothetical protein
MYKLVEHTIELDELDQRKAVFIDSFVKDEIQNVIKKGNHFRSNVQINAFEMFRNDFYTELRYRHHIPDIAAICLVNDGATLVYTIVEDIDDKPG